MHAMLRIGFLHVCFLLYHFRPSSPHIISPISLYPSVAFSARFFSTSWCVGLIFGHVLSVKKHGCCFDSQLGLGKGFSFGIYACTNTCSPISIMLDNTRHSLPLTHSHTHTLTHSHTHTLTHSHSHIITCCICVVIW
ncbi:hypothetical protein B0J11DRAFT_219742 [Dendryphion nanum]|uniref:Secreted protein n=1 Tax=Dendryphion nanum TaxID=256645 RepID=A0A9P9E5B3_9PLEO|nr:hypothetical protein B0J11DRAFT_219742 [Dendryphion nanum]